MTGDVDSAESEQRRRPAALIGGRRFLTRPVASLGLNAALFLAVVGTRGYFGRLFADFGVELPELTQMLLSPFFVWLTGLLFGATILVQLIFESRTTKTACNAVSSIAAMLLSALYVFFGISVPLAYLARLLLH